MYCKQISLASVGSALSVSATLGLPRSQRVCFPSLHCSGSRLLYQELAEAGPGFSTLKATQVKAAQLQVLGYSTKAQT